MFTDKTTIILSGIICIGFILCGILDILRYLAIQIVLTILFIIMIVELFYKIIRSQKNKN